MKDGKPVPVPTPGSVCSPLRTCVGTGTLGRSRAPANHALLQYRVPGVRRPAPGRSAGPRVSAQVTGRYGGFCMIRGRQAPIIERCGPALTIACRLWAPMIQPCPAQKPRPRLRFGLGKILLIRHPWSSARSTVRCGLRSCPLAWCWRWGTAISGTGRAGQLAIAVRGSVWPSTSPSPPGAPNEPGRSDEGHFGFFHPTEDGKRRFRTLPRWAIGKMAFTRLPCPPSCFARAAFMLRTCCAWFPASRGRTGTAHQRRRLSSPALRGRTAPRQVDIPCIPFTRLPCERNRDLLANHRISAQWIVSPGVVQLAAGHGVCRHGPGGPCRCQLAGRFLEFAP